METQSERVELWTVQSLRSRTGDSACKTRRGVGQATLFLSLAPQGCPLLWHQQQSPSLHRGVILLVSWCPWKLSIHRYSYIVAGSMHLPRYGPLRGLVIKQPRGRQIESVQETRERRHRGDGQLATTMVSIVSWVVRERDAWEVAFEMVWGGIFRERYSMVESMSGVATIRVLVPLNHPQLGTAQAIDYTHTCWLYTQLPFAIPLTTLH